MDQPKSVAFHNLGCKVNAYETDAMIQAFAQDGFRIVPFDEKADIYIVNTCSVTNIADRKSRQMLHRAKKTNADAFVVAVGCYVQASFEQVCADVAVDFAVGNNKKAAIVSSVKEAYKEWSAQRMSQGDAASKTIPAPLTRYDVAAIEKEKAFDPQFLTKIDAHTRAFIKVQDGCNQFCSYCIIPYTRGRIRSRHPLDVLAEIKKLIRNGIREVVLTGIHLSSYGLDYAKDGCTQEVVVANQPKKLSDWRLPDLIALLSEVEGIERIRLGSLEPRIVTDAFVESLKQFPKVCPHFHLSLQSGCDETLKRMNRKYDTEEYEKCCERLRRAYESPAITTDVIVGFPGETEEEFQTTLAYLKKLHLYEMHIFKYSVRKNTLAAKLPMQILESVKTQRSDTLLALEAQLSRSYREEVCLRATEEVLLEECMELEGSLYEVGYTTRYVKVAVWSDTKEGRHLNQVVRVVPRSMLTDEIVLAVIE